MRSHIFWFHYNKPASRAADKPLISVHWKGACHIVEGIECRCPTWGQVNKRQPFFVMKGRAMEMTYEGEKVILA